MSELYKRIEALCQKEGITITEMCRRAGVPRANLTELKMGRQQTLGMTALERISKYFKVSVGSLIHSDAKKAPASEETGASDDELKFALFGGGGEITDEMFEKVKAFAQWVKARNGGK